MTKSEKSTIRSYIADRSGVERVRITRDGEVHAFGAIPHTNQTGWYLSGHDTDILALARQEAAVRRSED